MAGDKFMLEMHLKQPGFTYSACEPFAINKERIEKLKIKVLFIKKSLIKHVMAW